MEIIATSPDGDTQQLADTVRVANTVVSQSLGLMGKRPLQPGEAMLFTFRETRPRRVHTWFVRGTIDILWVSNEQLVAIETLSPWSIGGKHSADTIIELPAGTASDLDRDWTIRRHSTAGD